MIVSQMTLGLLPIYKFNYRARIASVAFQGLVLAAVMYFGAMPAVRLVQTAAHLVYTPIVVDVTPKWQPSVRIVTPVFARVVPKPFPVIQTPVIEPPKVEFQAKAPAIPVAGPVIPRKPVEVGGFKTDEKVTLAKGTPVASVQTGGFGDSNGIKGVGNGKGLTVNSLGSFGMPTGPGYGNGTGGARGKIGVVGDVGFGGSGSGGSGGSVEKAAKVVASTPLVVLEHARPQYTDEGRKLGIQGEVLLRVRFTATGGVEVLRVIQGLGHGLDEQARLAAEKIKFKPAEHGGQPMDSEATVHIIFELAS